MIIDERERMIQELENQKKMNKELMQENRMLWSTGHYNDLITSIADIYCLIIANIVPWNEIFNTMTKTGRPNPLFGHAFTEKVDFSHIELNWTDSPHLSRMEEGVILYYQYYAM
jgi:hypothetical protein